MHSGLSLKQVENYRQACVALAKLTGQNQILAYVEEFANDWYRHSQIHLYGDVVTELPPHLRSEIRRVPQGSYSEPLQSVIWVSQSSAEQASGNGHAIRQLVLHIEHPSPLAAELHLLELFLQQALTLLVQFTAQDEHKNSGQISANAKIISAIEHAANGIAIVEPDFHISTCNPAWSHYLGVDCSQKNLLQVCDKADRAQVQQALYQLVDGQIDRYQQAIKVNGTAQRYAYLSISTMRDSQAGFQLLVAQLQDITELKMSQLALSQSEDKLAQKTTALYQERARLRAIIDSSPDMIYYKDYLQQDGAYLGCNLAFSQWIGIEETQLCGKTDYDLFDEQTAEGLRCRDKLLLASGEPITLEEWSQGKAQEKRLLDTQIVPYSNEAGAVIGVLGICRDITERREKDEIYKVLFERFSNGLLLLEQDKVIDCNQLAVDTLGFEQCQQLSGRSFAEFSPELQPDGQASVKKAQIMLQLANICGLHKFDWMFANGERTFPVEVTLSPVLIHGQAQLLMSWHDISERKNKEQELRQAKRLAEAATEAKSQFLANISHEIRTPLNAVIGLAQLSLSHNPEPKQYDYLVKINSASRALLALINDVLDFSKIEAGKLQIEKIEFSLRDLLQDLAHIFTPSIRQKGLELYFSLAEDTHDALMGDWIRIKQILMNLISNAIKFTNKGAISIEVDFLPLDANRLQLSCSVKDSGIGISKEKQAQLFNAFTQADASTTREFGGTGLGLAISKRLAELMEGHIQVQSEPGQGSCFSFTAKVGLADKPNLPSNISLHQPLMIKNVQDRQLTKLLEDMQHQGLRYEYFNQTQHLADNDRYVLLTFDANWSDWLEHYPAYKLVALLYPEQRQMLENKGLLPDDVRVIEKPVLPGKTLDQLITALSQTTAQRDQKQPPHSLQKKFAGQSVLLVEDNFINQQVAREMLEISGLSVTIAENGLQAVEMVDKQQFSLILMDIQMPKMDGYQAAIEIRNMKLFEQPPIVAMTANALVEDKQKCFQVGMDEYVAKPIDMDILFEKVERFIEPQANTNNVVELISGESVLPEILPGISVSKGVKQFCGNEQAYVNATKLFVVEFSDVFTQLKQLLSANQLEQAQALTHKVKGVAGNLCFEQCHLLCSEIDSGLRQQSVPSPTQLKRLSDEVADILSSINFIEQRYQSVSIGKQDFNPEQFNALMSQLDKKVVANEFVEDELMTQIKSLLPVELDDDFALLEKALMAYDYAEAKQHLNNLDTKLT